MKSVQMKNSYEISAMDEEPSLKPHSPTRSQKRCLGRVLDTIGISKVDERVDVPMRPYLQSMCACPSLKRYP